MGEATTIQWTDATHNPWWGCAKVSPGCTNCYAEALDRRYGGGHWGLGAPRRRTSEANRREPLRWNKAAAEGLFVRCDDCGRAGVGRRTTVAGVLMCGNPKCRSVAVERVPRPKVFCASMADWLDDAVPVEWLADLLALIAATPHLDWLLLTKRPELWTEQMGAVVSAAIAGASEVGGDVAMDWLNDTPPANVWLGTSVEDQRRADERIPSLLNIPARVRFLSCEPLLEKVSVRAFTHELLKWPKDEAPTHWVIVGGESGGGARPFNVAWARDVARQCRAAGVPVFVKQLGAHVRDRNDAGFDAYGDTWAEGPDAGQPTRPTSWPEPLDVEHDPDGYRAEYQGAEVRVRLRERKGDDWSEWPLDLRVRQFPTVEPAVALGCGGADRVLAKLRGLTGSGEVR